MHTKRYDDGDTFEHKGRTFKVFIRHDDDVDEPWKEEDGHGPVTDWTTESKRPGWWLLNTDRSSSRYYDAQAAMAKAKKEGWGLCDEAKAELIERLARPRTLRRPKKGAKPMLNQTGFIRQTFSYANHQIETVNVPGRDPNKPLTEGEILAEAVRLDYERLRGWCNDQWHYVGVIVVHVPNGVDEREVEVDYSYALWRINSDDDDYIIEVAHELAEEATSAIEREMDQMRAELRTHRVTERKLRAERRNLPGHFQLASEIIRNAIEAERVQAAAVIKRLREYKGS